MFPDSDRPPSIASAAPPLFAAASAGALPTLNMVGEGAATVIQRAAALPAPRPVAHRGARLGLTAFGLTLGVGSVFVAKEALVAGRDAVKHHPDVAALAALGALGALFCGGIWWLGTRP